MTDWFLIFGDNPFLSLNNRGSVPPQGMLLVECDDLRCLKQDHMKLPVSNRKLASKLCPECNRLGAHEYYERTIVQVECKNSRCRQRYWLDVPETSDTTTRLQAQMRRHVCPSCRKTGAYSLIKVQCLQEACRHIFLMGKSRKANNEACPKCNEKGVERL